MDNKKIFLSAHKYEKVNLMKRTGRKNKTKTTFVIKWTLVKKSFDVEKQKKANSKI